MAYREDQHQYRVVLTIEDNFHPKNDIGHRVAFPSHPSLEKVVREYKRMLKVLDEHMLSLIDK